MFFKRTFIKRTTNNNPCLRVFEYIIVIHCWLRLSIQILFLFPRFDFYVKWPLMKRHGTFPME